MRALTTLLTGLSILATGIAVPAVAQTSTRVVTIFGDEKCPTSNGEEIVVCDRQPAREQFRIPPQLRTSDDHAPSATTRLDAMRAASTSNIGSCSASGPGGMTGCQLEMNRNWKADQKAKAAGEVVPRQ